VEAEPIGWLNEDKLSKTKRPTVATQKIKIPAYEPISTSVDWYELFKKIKKLFK